MYLNFTQKTEAHLFIKSFFIKKKEKSDFLAIFNDFFTQKNSEKFYKKN